MTRIFEKLAAVFEGGRQNRAPSPVLRSPPYMAGRGGGVTVGGMSAMSTCRLDGAGVVTSNGNFDMVNRRRRRSRF
jgi:hypothetical protein